MSGKTFRRRDKRLAHAEYKAAAEELKTKLTGGKIKQDEFERAHELLDERFRWLR